MGCIEYSLGEKGRGRVGLAVSSFYYLIISITTLIDSRGLSPRLYRPLYKEKSRTKVRVTIIFNIKEGKAKDLVLY